MKCSTTDRSPKEVCVRYKELYSFIGDGSSKVICFFYEKRFKYTIRDSVMLGNNCCYDLITISARELNRSS
jgi:hypothetical protein